MLLQAWLAYFLAEQKSLVLRWKLQSHNLSFGLAVAHIHQLYMMLLKLRADDDVEKEEVSLDLKNLVSTSIPKPSVYQ
ncbi:hypothetical protein L1987_64812 [Smallanthus sonchifolius]|uniref:Uncharacterized protein n=1 Tax=Smallanthus sonchifolius TaxID=185202 RepID=A0ACB9BSS0_9ASTR|nr:hypothetical protein L1987_64812 [Smallanthus sonchifolius]